MYSICNGDVLCKLVLSGLWENFTSLSFRAHFIKPLQASRIDELQQIKHGNKDIENDMFKLGRIHAVLYFDKVLSFSAAVPVIDNFLSHGFLDCRWFVSIRLGKRLLTTWHDGT